MKITIEDYNAKMFLMLRNVLTPEEEKNGVESKLKYAIQRFQKLNKHALDKYQDKCIDIREDNATEIEKGGVKVLLTDEKGNLQFTKEASKKIREEIKKLDTMEIEFEPYLFSDEVRISQIDEMVVEDLRGFLFPIL